MKEDEWKRLPAPNWQKKNYISLQNVSLAACDVCVCLSPFSLAPRTLARKWQEKVWKAAKVVKAKVTIQFYQSAMSSSSLGLGAVCSRS